MGKSVLGPTWEKNTVTETDGLWKRSTLPGSEGRACGLPWGIETWSAGSSNNTILLILLFTVESRQTERPGTYRGVGVSASSHDSDVVMRRGEGSAGGRTVGAECVGRTMRPLSIWVGAAVRTLDHMNGCLTREEEEKAGCARYWRKERNNSMSNEVQEM